MTMHHVFDLTSYSRGDHQVFDQLNGLTELVGHQELSVPIDELRRSPDVSFVKTHALPSDDSPAVYIVRNGLDSVVSFAHYQLKFRKRVSRLTRTMNRLIGRDPFHRVLETLIQGGGPYGRWADHVMSWTRRTHGNTVVVRYEQLVNEPVQCVTRSLELAGHPVALDNTREPPSFDELHARWGDFFRRGRIGTGYTEMPPRLRDLFWKLHGHAMNEMGYPREPLREH